MLDIQDETPVIANVRFLAAITRDDFASDNADLVSISQRGATLYIHPGGVATRTAML